MGDQYSFALARYQMSVVPIERQSGKDGVLTDIKCREMSLP